MKIERLYTLSQFVDEHAEKWALVRKYNNFLKQGLTKDMFVNYMRCPIAPCENYQIKIKKFREAEANVIFEGFVECGDWFIKNNPKNPIGIQLSQYKTLHDLAYATNGQLELKNFEI